MVIFLYWATSTPSPRLKLRLQKLYKALYSYYQTDERNQNAQRQWDIDQARYKVLSAGVLSTDLAERMLDQNISRINLSSLEEIKKLSYDAASVVEVAGRLQQNQDLVDWLPLIRKNAERNYNFLARQRERADEILADLKETLY